MSIQTASRYIDIAHPPNPIAPSNWTVPLIDNFPVEIQSQLETWKDLGFVHLKNFFTREQIEEANNALEKAFNAKEIQFNYTGRKIFNAYKKVPVLSRMVKNPLLSNVLDFLLQYRAVHFQSINFLKGSEQNPHSDAIHMTTIPLGGLLGVWVALEDINSENGPLVYYPASHLLPYVCNDDYGNSSNAFWLDGQANKKYESFVKEEISRLQLKEYTLEAKAGDVFIWHANLIHGGGNIHDPNSTRKSMVSHYFAEGHLCFHEISERPALIECQPDFTSS